MKATSKVNPKTNQTGNLISIMAQQGQAHRYAGQTRSRNEKSVAKQMDKHDIEHFLPLYDKISRWKDRQVRLQLPLFPGYILVRVSLKDQINILQIPGMVRLVRFSGHPTVIAEAEIVALKRWLSAEVSIEPYPYLKSGQLVVVQSGSLAGLSGHFMRRKLANRIVISIDSIMRSFIAKVSLDDIEIAKKPRAFVPGQGELPESRV